jgi:glycosyltransferase involved in cell wall biosynthesis/GT2 family glycosyltransferase
VLVYDIIPLENPEFVSDAHQTMFTGWLRTTLALAKIVFVSSVENRDRLLRWAALAEVPLGASVVPIAFGANKPAPALGAGQLLRATATSRVRMGGFVLSVGTIDRRKNQAALCRLWPRLHATLPPDQVPQLVLVGRDDVGLEMLSDQVAALIEAGNILVLQGVSDAELAGLYDTCLFTVFPSLSEGYGLPVAESLAHGKLCIASDLAVIRDHAGDLPWYVPPGDQAALLEALRRVITDTQMRAEAEGQIARHYMSQDWTETWRVMHAAALATPVAAQHGDRSVMPVRPDLPGVPRPEIQKTLPRAQRWCTGSAPDVSILIVNWNAAPLTLECIRQIWANTEGLSYEILVADNGSDPASLHVLRQLGRGVRLLELGVNRYFGEANNIAAEEAKGRFLCLLNNDAFVRPGWLQALAAALDNNEQAGAAGPLFLFPDGTIQEAGGSIDALGYPVRAARGEALGTQELSPGVVDYISAAALLVRTECFLQVGGFDLAYEPAYYEDADLCFKLRAMDRPVLFCPAAQVIHIEGAAASDDPTAVVRRNVMGDLNRSKFTARWSAFLETRSDDVLRQIAARVLPAPGRANTLTPGAQTAALFTPYSLTPGGGERFLLTIAAALSEDHETTIVTPYPYSRLRLLNLGRELAIDLGGCRLATEAQFLASPAPDRLITMGNQIVPPIPARAKDSVFVCQFPFPMEGDAIRTARDGAGSYRLVLTYSEYVRAHVLAALSAHQMPPWPIEVVPPPVPQHTGNAGRKRRMVLTVGRFFEGGHSKRHDLMIDAFRCLLERTGPNLEMHIAGSSIPDPMQMSYLDRLQRQAKDLPVTFHVNTSNERLAELYRDAALYWHAAGLAAPLAESPGSAEHFGITVLEAMSAGCVPMVFNAGGPREIVTHGADGILYNSLHELVDSAAQLLAPESDQMREAMGHAAARRAVGFAPIAFHNRIRKLLLG